MATKKQNHKNKKPKKRVTRSKRTGRFLKK